MKKLTLKIAINSFKLLNLILLATEYINVSTKMPYVCKICNFKGKKTLKDVRSLKGCPNCFENRRGQSLKLSLEQVRDDFKKVNLTLLSDTYIDQTKKLEYVCDICGYVGEKTLQNVRHCNSGCPVCAGVLKYDYSFIQNEFIKQGYILLSKEYINSKTMLDCICPNGHKFSIRWNDFQSGTRCSKCSNNKQHTYFEVKSVFAEQGYTLLSKSYSNVNSKLVTICPNSKIYYTRFNDFNRGVRCHCSLCKLNKKKGNHKGGITKLGLPLYETYAKKLKLYQHVYLIRKYNLDLLGVQCHNCKKIFVPTMNEVCRRISIFVNDKGCSENNLYCSEKCKNDCSTYRQRRYKKGERIINNRTVFSKKVKNRDNYTCTICGCTNDTTVINAHHVLSASLYPEIADDVDNGISVCKKCHEKIHNTIGCSMIEIKKSIHQERTLKKYLNLSKVEKNKFRDTYIINYKKLMQVR